MKSIKRGRGPSMMSGISSIFVAIFGVIWFVLACSMSGMAGGGIFSVFPLFGVVFIGMAIVSAVYNFKNATNQNRYSEFDITEDGEEVDPLQKHFGKTDFSQTKTISNEKQGAFCPYCGTKTKEDHVFCNKCGKKLS